MKPSSCFYSLVQHPFEVLDSVVPCVAEDIFHRARRDPIQMPAFPSTVVAAVAGSHNLTPKHSKVETRTRGFLLCEGEKLE